MKLRNLVILVAILVLLAVLSVPGFFIYTRFLTDQYHIQGNTLTLGKNVYVGKQLWESSDEENLGNTIGIAIEGERTITDLIWPNWVKEYKNDPGHNRLFVRGLMDLGQVYYKQTPN